MKKLILSLTAVSLFATASNAQLAIAPELGLNLANMAFKTPSVTLNTSMKVGLAVGGVVDLGITDNIYFQPGIFYLMNGCNYTGGSYNVSTLQIPLNFEYKFGKDGGTRFFVGVGPYLGYNVGGKVKDDQLGSSSLKIGSAKADANGPGDDLKALDLGFGVNVGYLLTSGFYARAHYQMGLVNLDPNGDSNNTVTTSAVGITIGYYLPMHKKAHKGNAEKKK